MKLNLKDAVIFNGELGEIDGLEIDSNNGEIVAVEIGFSKKFSNFNGRLTIRNKKINDIILFKKYIGGFPNSIIFSLSNLDDKKNPN